MKLVLQDSTYLKDSISIISELVNEARFKVTKEGLEMVAMDPANVAMVIFKLLASNFSEYETNEEREMHLHLGNLKQVLKRAKAEDQLTLELTEENKLRIQLKSNTTRTFNLPLLETDEKEQKIPNLNFQTIIDTNSSTLNEAIEDTTIIAESVTLSVDPQKMVVTAEGDLRSARIEIPSTEETKINSQISANIKSKYSIEYLKKMIQASKLADNVTIHLNQDYPLKLDYKVLDKLSLSFILAPRVEND